MKVVIPGYKTKILKISIWLSKVVAHHFEILNVQKLLFNNDDEISKSDYLRKAYTMVNKTGCDILIIHFIYFLSILQKLSNMLLVGP